MKLPSFLANQSKGSTNKLKNHRTDHEQTVFIRLFREVTSKPWNQALFGQSNKFYNVMNVTGVFAI